MTRTHTRTYAVLSRHRTRSVARLQEARIERAQGKARERDGRPGPNGRARRWLEKIGVTPHQRVVVSEEKVDGKWEVRVT